MKQTAFLKALCCAIVFGSLSNATTKAKSLLKQCPHSYRSQERYTDPAQYESNINVYLTEHSLWQMAANVHVVFMNNDLIPLNASQVLDGIAENKQAEFMTMLKRAKFEGKEGQTYLFTPTDETRSLCLFVGVGKLDKGSNRNLELFRRAIGDAVKITKELRAEHVALSLPSHELFGISQDALIQHAACTHHLAFYKFATFKKCCEEKRHDQCSFWFTGIEDNEANQAGVEMGNIVGKATNMARYWGDMPPNLLTPKVLAEQAEELAEIHDLECTILNEDDAEEFGMGGFLAVTRGSEQDGKFVILEYDSGVENAPTIALCGKGVIFDTGGVSLKTSAGMTGMKYDMCGAAAVIATMAVVGQLKPAINVVGITPLVENMPDGNSDRQDDIIRAMNGKSIEIKNTDAEGRLILADALCYAEKFYEPDIIVDIATLTGACKQALGHFHAALLGNDDYTINQLATSGRCSGDRVWQLPFNDDYKKANQSKVADVANTCLPTYLAGCISAGCFLSEFVDHTKWAHLDISGTARNVPGVSYFTDGGTGAGVRLFTDFIMNYKA